MPKLVYQCSQKYELVSRVPLLLSSWGLVIERFAPHKGIEDSLGFSIPRCRFRIPCDCNLFQSLGEMSKGRSILLDKLYKAKEDLTLGLLRSLHVGYPLLFLEILFLTEEKKVHEANLMAEALTGSSKVLDAGRHASRDADAFSRQNSTRKGPRKVANFNEAFQCSWLLIFFRVVVNT